jgi:Zn-dependent peptidase ImmA (M78 family)
MDRNPADEADKIRRKIWADISGSADVIPVDPVRIARALGVDVFEAELDSSVSGAIVKQTNRDPTILMNQRDHPNRQRFTAAHELGHYVLHQNDPEEYEYVDYRDEDASTGSKEEEVFANQFAAHLLMPADVVTKRYRGGATPVELAYEFRVSQEAMVNHLKNLGLLKGG